MAVLFLSGCAPAPSAPTLVPDVSVLKQQTYTVQRGEIVEAISFSARVLPLIQEFLVVQTTGRIGLIDVQPGDIVQAGQVLAELEGMDDLRQQVALNDLSIQRVQTEAEIAQLNLDLFRQETPEFEAGYQEQLAIKQRQVTLAQLAITEAQLQATELNRMMDKLRVVSPLNGQLRFLDIGIGDDVNAYDQVGIVADVSQLEIGADLPKEILSQLTEGMTVTVSPSHNPANLLPATIRQLPTPYGSSGAVSGNSPADAFSWIRLETDLAQADLQLDDLVTITVVLHRSNNGLWLPPEAIRTFEGQTFVVIQENGLQRRVNVQTGLRNTDQVEILDGLTEGQVVLGQ